MKKKMIISLGIIFIVVNMLFLFFFINQKMSNIESNPDSFTEKELSDMEYVDNKISKLMESKSYQELNLDDRVNEVKKVLKELKKKKYIKHYYYEDGSYMFSFEYKCGVLGGIMIKEFDPMMN